MCFRPENVIGEGCKNDVDNESSAPPKSSLNRNTNARYTISRLLGLYCRIRDIAGCLASVVNFWYGVRCSAAVISGFSYVFSERELTFTFAICYRPSVCLSSVCRLSSVCNVRAPYSGNWNFRQYFYGIRYLGHPLTSTKNFTEIVPGEPLRRGSWTQEG